MTLSCVCWFKELIAKWFGCRWCQLSEASCHLVPCEMAPANTGGPRVVSGSNCSLLNGTKLHQQGGLEVNLPGILC